ncbi:hypothetical protein KFK09_018706 [Dendrobium nobile]|uniref:Uncharacterized protein n=1 Tax=Dendrobium nobile TaxID=94219 RepID=A0A8T3AVI7_DENNO|nr:hypothetical protein KFK09_018706 [Dendrobium nobile]
MLSSIPAVSAAETFTQILQPELLQNAVQDCRLSSATIAEMDRWDYESCLVVLRHGIYDACQQNVASDGEIDEDIIGRIQVRPMFHGLVWKNLTEYYKFIMLLQNTGKVMLL